MPKNTNSTKTHITKVSKVPSSIDVLKLDELIEIMWNSDQHIFLFLINFIYKNIVFKKFIYNLKFLFKLNRLILFNKNVVKWDDQRNHDNLKY